MDSIFIFGLALILFGPKKLPEIGRQIGKIVLEFRKASNEFKMQIEDELRASEQAERQKKIAAETQALTDGAAPVTAAVETSAPSALTIQPPSTGEQVSSSSPYRTGSEQLAAVIVQSPGEDPNPDAIAEVYPEVHAAEDGHATVIEPGIPSGLEVVPPDRHTASHVEETDQAITHHG